MSTHDKKAELLKKKNLIILMTKIEVLINQTEIKREPLKNSFMELTHAVLEMILNDNTDAS